MSAELSAPVIYLLSYFRTEDEALHLAASEDGLIWSALNRNQPVLRATVGNRSIRDPFIRHCADGYYHLLSTDSWWSPNILHARSRDLVSWEPWDILPVMTGVPDTQNAWAPEYFYDAAREIYLLFWASITPDPPYQRIWYTETPDFRTLTTPCILFDPGYSVIDATLVEQSDTYFMLFKDERGENKPGTDFKAMRVATASDPRGPYTPRTGLVSPHLTEGPAVFRIGDRWRMLYDFFMHDRWGAAESPDLLAWELVPGLAVPPGARHGSVFSLPRSDYSRLQAEFMR